MKNRIWLIAVLAMTALFARAACANLGVSDIGEKGLAVIHVADVTLKCAPGGSGDSSCMMSADGAGWSVSEDAGRVDPDLRVAPGVEHLGARHLAIHGRAAGLSQSRRGLVKGPRIDDDQHLEGPRPLGVVIRDLRPPPNCYQAMIVCERGEEPLLGCVDHDRAGRGIRYEWRGSREQRGGRNRSCRDPRHPITAPPVHCGTIDESVQGPEWRGAGATRRWAPARVTSPRSGCALTDDRAVP